MMMPDTFWVMALSTARFCASASWTSVVRLMNLTLLGAGLGLSGLLQRVPEIVRHRKAGERNRDIPGRCGGRRCVGCEELVDVVLGDEDAGDHGLRLDLFALEELEDEVDAFLAHLGGVLADGGGHFAGL